MTRASIDFAGLAADGLGLALWQADGTGPEPTAAGHSFETPIGRINSHYYIASRDYAGIDPRARGGLAARAPLQGFTHLADALRTTGVRLADLVIRLPLTTPGEDREGIDWQYRDDVETRYLRTAEPIPIEIRSMPVLHMAVNRLVLTENYRGAHQFADVRLSLASDPLRVLPVAGASGVVATVANALLRDIGDRKLRFIAERVLLMPDGFAGSGRTHGYFAEIPAARLETIV